MRALDRAFIAAGIASLSMLIAVSSCNDSAKSDEVKQKPSKEALSATIEQGMWRVTYSVNESEKDVLKRQFSEYQFQFSDKGSIVAVNGSNTINGIWSAFESPKGLKLNVEFPLRGPFEELNVVWVVVEQTESKITLQELSGKSGTLDKLTLERV